VSEVTVIGGLLDPNGGPPEVPAGNPSMLPSPKHPVPILISSSLLPGGTAVETKGGGYSSILLKIVTGGTWTVGGKLQQHGGRVIFNFKP